MTDPSFLLDGMLGSLSRWLRLLGYDAEYVRDTSDREMLSLLQGNDRLLLTRDRQLAERAGDRGVLITMTDLNSQLMWLENRLGLRLQPDLRRCTACNGELQTVDKSTVQNEVAEGTWKGYDTFFRCRRCGKIYWQGAHWKNIRRRLDAISKCPGNNPR